MNLIHITTHNKLNKLRKEYAQVDYDMNEYEHDDDNIVRLVLLSNDAIIAVSGTKLAIIRRKKRKTKNPKAIRK